MCPLRQVLTTVVRTCKQTFANDSITGSSDEIISLMPSLPVELPTANPHPFQTPKPTALVIPEAHRQQAVE